MATPPPPHPFATGAAESAVDAAAEDATAEDATAEHPQQKQRLQQQQQLARNSLLADLRRSTNFWFRAAKSKDSLQLLAQSCTRILQHGLVSRFAHGNPQNITHPMTPYVFFGGFLVASLYLQYI